MPTPAVALAIASVASAAPLEPLPTPPLTARFIVDTASRVPDNPKWKFSNFDVQSLAHLARAPVMQDDVVLIEAYLERINTNAPPPTLRTGLFADVAGQLHAVAVEGNPFPPDPTASYASIPAAVRQISEEGHIVFSARLVGDNVHDDNDTALCRWQDGNLELLVREGDTFLPNDPAIAGNIFVDVAFPGRALGPQGHFAASIRTTGPADPSEALVLFKTDGERQLLLSSGDPVPGAPGNVFERFYPYAIDHQGDVLFWATTTTGEVAGITANGSTRMLMSTSSPAPGVPGATVADIRTLSFNIDGRVTVSVTLESADGSITALNQHAAYAIDDAEPPELILQGDTEVEGRPGAYVRFTSLPTVIDDSSYTVRTQLRGSDNSSVPVLVANGRPRLIATEDDTRPILGDVDVDLAGPVTVSTAGDTAFYATYDRGGNAFFDRGTAVLLRPAGGDTLRSILKSGDRINIRSAQPDSVADPYTIDQFYALLDGFPTASGALDNAKQFALRGMVTRLDVPPQLETPIETVLVVSYADLACSPADLAHPRNVVDLDDIDAFINAVLVADPSVDFASPFGVVDIDDVDAFITAFLAGCP